jgi:hypothetical protein
MDKIEIFPVPETPFKDGPEFRQYLSKEYDPSKVDHALTIVMGLTTRSEDDFCKALTDFGFVIERQIGKVCQLKFELPEAILETDVTYDRISDSGVIFFYTNFRKTEEVPKITDFLYEDPKSYPLFLRPSIMQKILDDLAALHNDLAIVDFTARHYPNSKAPARIRPAFERTFSYWGWDGLQTLQELQYHYGVLPTRMMIECPGVVKFSMDGRGFFTLQWGDLNLLFNILGNAIQESGRTISAFNGSDFKILPINTASKAFRLPSSTPVSIQLTKKLAYEDVDDLEAHLDEKGYVLLNLMAEAGSLYLSSDVIAKSGHRFRIKADERHIRMLPDGIPQFSAFMEFYEFVLNYVDPDAQLIT